MSKSYSKFGKKYNNVIVVPLSHHTPTSSQITLTKSDLGKLSVHGQSIISTVLHKDEHKAIVSVRKALVRDKRERGDQKQNRPEDIERWSTVSSDGRSHVYFSNKK